MISSADVVVYIFFYLFFIHYLFTFASYKSFIFVSCILCCYVLTLWATVSCYVLRLLNYTSVTSHRRRIDDQNCRGVGEYGLSSADEQISSGDIPEPEPSPCLVKSSRRLLPSRRRPDNQRSRCVGKRGMFSADEENLSGGVQERELLSRRIESSRCQSRPSKQLYVKLRRNGCCWLL